MKKLNADSLIALISEKDGTEKIEALNLLSNVICRQNIDSSILLATQAIELSEKLKYQKGLANGYFNVGNGYFLLDSLQPTISNYLKALRIYEDLEPTEEFGNLCNQLGLVNYFTGRMEVSMLYGRLALSIFNIINDKEGKAMANFSQCNGKHAIYQEYDSAIYYCKRALTFLDSSINQTEAAYIYREMGMIFFKQFFFGSNDTSYLTKAISNFNNGLVLSEKNDAVKAWVLLGLGRVYLNLKTDKSIATCIEYLNKADLIADSCFDAYDFKSFIYQMLGQANYLLGDIDNAILFYEQGIKIIDKRLADFSINHYKEPVSAYNWKYYHKVFKQMNYEGLYYIHYDRGDYKKALEYNNLSKQAEEEIYMEKNQNLITMLESVSKNEKTEKQMDMLANDNELKAFSIKQSRSYLFVLAGFILILVLVGLLIFRQRKLRAEHKLFVREQKLLHDLELKNVESEKLKELDQMKSRFFANISHEFRTPLTLIMGPLNKVLSKTKDNSDKKELGIAKKYAGNLQVLINNLLSISKLESGKMVLHASDANIINLIHTYIQSFESLAKQKNIELQFLSDYEDIQAFIDQEKFEHILNNLLSNAFKFTAEGDVIEVAITPSIANCHFDPAPAGEKSPHHFPNQTTDSSPGFPGFGMTGKKEGEQVKKCVEIKITDTGCGISTEHIHHIFDRFYQVENKEANYSEGTGIGLALTKELVELHHGKIKVKSIPGKGSIFTILLPLGKEHLKPEEIDSSRQSAFDVQQSKTEADILNIESEILNPEQGTNNDTPLMLIVEDNADMRSYIRGYFETEYNITEAIDGSDGYKKSTENIPDIIISDVMMPIMDGNEFCKKVKTDERTSHIPVILLTARASKENRIEGLETDADDFITKPFDGKELQVRVKNLIEQRKRFSLRMEAEFQKSQNFSSLKFKDSSITSMDEQFLQKVMQNINDHYADPEFSASALSLKIGLSRVQLHRKIKALIGQTTSDLIRSFRLTRAAELIKKKSATVAEIAYDVGFNSPSYFTQCFKLYFGKSPTELYDKED